MVEDGKHWLESRGLTVALSVVVIFTLMVSLIGGVRQQAYIHCVARYDNKVNVYLSARAHSIDQQNVATTNVIDGVANATTEMDVQYALGNYLIAENAIIAERKAHPVPDPPSEVCN